MVSNKDTVRRALVTLLKSLAGIYCVVVILTRQSTDVEVSAAFKKVARKAHPDKGGGPEHQKDLNAARGTWQDALRQPNFLVMLVDLYLLFRPDPFCISVCVRLKKEKPQRYYEGSSGLHAVSAPPPEAPTFNIRVMPFRI